MIYWSHLRNGDLVYSYSKIVSFKKIHENKNYVLLTIDPDANYILPNSTHHLCGGRKNDKRCC